MGAYTAAERDRVLALVKVSALLVVVLGHSLAWDLTGGEPGSVLQVRPGLGVVTWLFQLLPLFFAAGAVTNLASWRRYRHRPEDHRALDYQRHRLVRLSTPAVVYTVVWTTLCLSASFLSDDTVSVGRFLAQLLWFLGIYGLVVVAVPLTSRWVGRPWLILGLGLFVIGAVDLLRWQVAPMLGWLNFVLVWGWLHQLGYHLPQLRQGAHRALLTGAAAAFGAAVLLAVVGPYSTAMVSVSGDEKLSNLSPPTLVLALVGLAQVLVLAVVWPTLARLMRHPRPWLAVAAVGSRAIGIYLWHIPLVGLVAVLAWLAPWRPEALSWPWWLAHGLGLAAVLSGAWAIAGYAGRVDSALQRWGAALPTGRAMRLAVVVLPLVVLNVSVTGVATWWGPGMLGLPSSALLNALLLVVSWRIVIGRGGGFTTTRTDSPLGRVGRPTTRGEA